MPKILFVRFLFCLLFSSIQTFSQQAINYFLPSNKHNAAEYKDQTDAGLKLNITRHIIYKLERNSLETTETLFSSNNIVDITLYIYKITTKEVLKEATDKGSGKKYFNSPICVLKVPPKNGSISWTTYFGSEKLENTSSWITVEYLNEQKSGIKVVRKPIGRTSYTIDYYIEGVGFWKSEIITKTKIITTDKLERVYSNNLQRQNELGHYEEKLLSMNFEEKEGVSIKERDYRLISWSQDLNKASNYTREKIEALGFEYLKIIDKDQAHITYLYRKCSNNILLKVTEWYGLKLSILLEWYSDQVKNSIPSFAWCTK